MQRFQYALAFGVMGLLAASCDQNTSPMIPVTTTTNTTSNASISIVAGARTMDTTAYQPNPVTIAKGGTVTWTNNDSITHTSTSDGAVWNSGAMAPGAVFSQTFPTAGTFQYHCTIHPNMVGTMTVQ